MARRRGESKASHKLKAWWFNNFTGRRMEYMTDSKDEDDKNVHDGDNEDIDEKGEKG